MVSIPVQVCRMMNNEDWTYKWDDDAQVPYTYGPTSNNNSRTWISLENRESLVIKVSLMKLRHLHENIAVFAFTRLSCIFLVSMGYISFSLQNGNSNTLAQMNARGTRLTVQVLVRTCCRDSSLRRGHIFGNET